MTINSRNLLLAFAVLLTACSPYDDGPSISFRSKGMRMNWERPISYYESGGIDSTSAIIQLFQDSIVGFDGEVISSWDSPSDYSYFLTREDSLRYTIGTWRFSDDYTQIWMNIFFAQHWRFNWTVKRLSNKDLWLESPDGKKLRFEEE